MLAASGWLNDQRSESASPAALLGARRACAAPWCASVRFAQQPPTHRRSPPPSPRRAPEIGLGLAAFGFLFTLLGIMMFFDRGLLAMGNVSGAPSERPGKSGRGCRIGRLAHTHASPRALNCSRVPGGRVCTCEKRDAAPQHWTHRCQAAAAMSTGRGPERARRGPQPAALTPALAAAVPGGHDAYNWGAGDASIFHAAEKPAGAVVRVLTGTHGERRAARLWRGRRSCNAPGGPCKRGTAGAHYRHGVGLLQQRTYRPELAPDGAHTRTHTDTCLHILAHTYIHTHTRTHARTHARTHTRTQANVRAHARTHTHTHTHTSKRTRRHAPTGLRLLPGWRGAGDRGVDHGGHGG